MHPEKYKKQSHFPRGRLGVMSTPDEIVRLLRTLIRLADSADDCVAANAICERIERDQASQTGSNEVVLTPEEHPIVLHLLRRLLVQADSYDLALEASVAASGLRSRCYALTMAMDKETDLEAVQASAECVAGELGLYHTEDVYQKAMRIELGAKPASLVVRYRGEIVGTQHIDLMFRGHAVEVMAQCMARGWEGWDVHEECTRKANASGCGVILVVFSPTTGVHVKQFDAK